MTHPRWLEEAEVTNEVGPCTPISRYCKCRRATLPLRAVDRTISQLLVCLEVARESGCEPPEPSAAFETYRCPDCKKIAQITMTMIGLTT